MTVQLNNLKPSVSKSKKRIGRGGKSGTYSGKGMKGQRARSGGSGGLKLKGFKAQIQKLPKLRGFKSKFPQFIGVNVSVLEKNFKAGDNVDFKTLISRGILKNVDRKARLKILGNGEITKKMTVTADAFSAKAKELIEKAGGEARVSEPKKAELTK